MSATGSLQHAGVEIHIAISMYQYTLSHIGRFGIYQWFWQTYVNGIFLHTFFCKVILEHLWYYSPTDFLLSREHMKAYIIQRTYGHISEQSMR